MHRTKLYYFNPGHETEVLHGSNFYTPPRHVREMSDDLAFLPAWYGDSGDFVLLANSGLPDVFVASLPEIIRPQAVCLDANCLKMPDTVNRPLLASPWGTTLQSIRIFREVGERLGCEIIIPDWNESYPQLLSRKTAAACLNEMRKHLPQLPYAPVFCSSMEEVETFVTANSGNCVLKAPYSSSGRGLYWLRDNSISPADANWIRGIIRRQGAISIEVALDRQLDFAFEFFSDGKGRVNFEGISVFQTSEKGAYKGNRLMSQKRLLELLEKYIDAENLNSHIEALTGALEKVYAHNYAGYMGVDMLIYKTAGAFALHPCIEVNLRYTMGMLAIRLFEKLLHADSSATLHIIYNKKSALDWHLEMQNAHPLKFIENKISEGYLSLCPVTENTRYIACIIAP